MVTGLAGSKHFTLNLNLLEVALTGKVDVYLRRHTHSSKAYDEAKCELFRRAWVATIDGKFTLAISRRQSDWQLSSLVQVCGSIFTPAVERLTVLGRRHREWPMDGSFTPIRAMKDLYYPGNSRRVSRQYRAHPTRAWLGEE